MAREEAALRALAEKAAKKARAAAEREAKAGERQRQRELRKKCGAPRASQVFCYHVLCSSRFEAGRGVLERLSPLGGARGWA